MRFSCVLFLIAISMELAVSVTIKTMVFPTETDTDYVEMTPLKPLDLTAFTLCMRVATELSGKREVILFAYRIPNTDELNVWREQDGRLSLYLRSSSEAVHFQVPQLGALETHLCVTWDSNSGATALFLDGRKSLTKIYKMGHRVQSGGRVILGQDPDKRGYSFDAKQSFVGEISDVNMWDSVLPDSTIQRMSSGTRVTKGNVFDWEVIQFESHGGATVLNREL